MGKADGALSPNVQSAIAKPPVQGGENIQRLYAVSNPDASGKVHGAVSAAKPTAAAKPPHQPMTPPKMGKAEDYDQPDYVHDPYYDSPGPAHYRKPERKNWHWLAPLNQDGSEPTHDQAHAWYMGQHKEYLQHAANHQAQAKAAPKRSSKEWHMHHAKNMKQSAENYKWRADRVLEDKAAGMPWQRGLTGAEHMKRYLPKSKGGFLEDKAEKSSAFAAHGGQDDLNKAAPKGVDESKYKRCKEEVAAKQGGSEKKPYNVYAVCASSLKKATDCLRNGTNPLKKDQPKQNDDQPLEKAQGAGESGH
jgi:hypothetical protein